MQSFKLILGKQTHAHKHPPPPLSLTGMQYQHLSKSKCNYPLINAYLKKVIVVGAQVQV